MPQPSNKFYNMEVSLIKNGRIYKEHVAIRNVWEKDRNIFLDLYFYRLQKSFIFDAVFVRDISDLNRDVYYNDIGKFTADFQAAAKEGGLPQANIKGKSSNSSGILSAIADDIMLLLFISSVWKDKTEIKQKIIIDYIKENVSAASSLSERYLKEYLLSLKPKVNDFYFLLPKLKSKQPKEAEKLLKEAIKICSSDGYLHYNERMYLADIIQTLREYGLKVPSDLI